MTAYSIRGYGVAVSLRSVKTILVEGPTDRKILSRLILQRQLKQGTRATCVIDEIALASNDERLAGKGNKERIEIVAATLGTQSQKLNYLVDREWEGVDTENLPTEHSVLNLSWGVRTKGHSIENYWLQEAVLGDYLKMFYGADLSADFFDQLSHRFDCMLRLAAAYSFAIKRLALIARCSSVVRASHIEWVGSRYLLMDQFNHELKIRNVTDDVAAAVRLELDKPAFSRTPVEVLRWLCHGHLGEEIVRACAAHLASTFGPGRRVVEAIERGSKAEKLAHHADCLANLRADSLEPLNELVSWIE